MRPETRSRTLLSITRSKAKMYEYSVPAEHHIKIPRDPARLFTLAVGLLGDVAACMTSADRNEGRLRDLKADLVFSAHFFDSYRDSRLKEELDRYVLLLGSASYYLSDLPGSSSIVAERIGEGDGDLGCSGLDYLLQWLLMPRRRLDFRLDAPSSLYGEQVGGIAARLTEFYRTGMGEDSLWELAAHLKKTAYDKGTPRELLFADVICAVLQKRIRNSAWCSLPLYTGIPAETWAPVLTKRDVVSELWPAQQLIGEQGVFRGRSAVIQMPTSAGKTRANEMIIRSAFLGERTNLAVIVAPFRALCHEIQTSLSSAFRREGISADEMTDVLQNDYAIHEVPGQRQVLVVTPEKLLYVLRSSPQIAERVGLLIYDEGHQFDSDLRGVTYELLLTSLRSMVPAAIQTVLVSAVIPNADSIGEWLIGDDCELVYGGRLIPTYRTIAFVSWSEERGRLEFVDQQNTDRGSFFVPRVIDQHKLHLRGKERRARFFPERHDGSTIALFLGLKLCANGSIAVFCGTKPTAAGLCDRIVDAYDRGLAISPPAAWSDEDEVERLAFLYSSNLGDEAMATRSANLGILSHHGDTPHGIRLAVEHAMRSRKARFVICTSTLAQGVNLPIRYLIVTGIYQGRRVIRVRDFHNLIGRAGRADQHTEGSIIFADPDVYDERETPEGRRRWRRFGRLLDPENSEPCVSSLLSLLEPLSSDDGRYRVAIPAEETVAAYVGSPEALETLVARVLSQGADKGFTREGVENQIRSKLHIIGSIENYLMAHWDEPESGSGSENTAALVSKTLAYFLANEEQREQLVRVFMYLAHNVQQSVAESSKRKIYSRTLYGVRTSLEIDYWVSQHMEQLAVSENHDALLGAIWPVLLKNIRNDAFRRLDPVSALHCIAQRWIRGDTYAEMHRLACEAGAFVIGGSQRRHVKVDHIVSICDNGLSYHGTLLVGAIAEIVEFLADRDSARIGTRLRELQKMLKYGLPDSLSIALFEMAFPDRVVSMRIRAALGNGEADRRSVRSRIRTNQAKVREILEEYPSYFSARLDNLL